MSGARFIGRRRPYRICCRMAGGCTGKLVSLYNWLTDSSEEPVLNIALGGCAWDMLCCMNYDMTAFSLYGYVLSCYMSLFILLIYILYSYEYNLPGSYNNGRSWSRRNKFILGLPKSQPSVWK
jgi:hypothetical protein